jgi:hypothetical protein
LERRRECQLLLGRIGDLVRIHTPYSPYTPRCQEAHFWQEEARAPIRSPSLRRAGGCWQAHRPGSLRPLLKHRITVYPSPEQVARWESWGRSFRKPHLSKFIPFIMDGAIRYLRQWDRSQRTDLDEIGLQLGQRDRLRKIVEDARNAMDKLAEALR